MGRTVYDADDQLIGVMDTPELAAQVVAAVNRTSPTLPFADVVLSEWTRQAPKSLTDHPLAIVQYTLDVARMAIDGRLPS